MIYPRHNSEIWDHSTPPELWGEWSYMIDAGMYKLNLNKFYRFGAEMVALRHGKLEESPGDTWKRLSGPARWLRNLILDIDSIPAPNTGKAATELLEYLDAIMAEALARTQVSNSEPVVTLVEFANMATLLGALEHELEHESRDANVFAVADKGTHSTTKLITDANLNLPADVRLRLRSESIADIKAAGRCLGFNTPTAAAFHILRAVEPLILRYRNALVGSTLQPKSRNWGAYIKDLTKHGGDPRVIAMIDHIRSFYRNPIMHPEETLTTDQALSLFHTCLSAIVQLDGAIQVLDRPTQD